MKWLPVERRMRVQLTESVEKEYLCVLVGEVSDAKVT